MRKKDLLVTASDSSPKPPAGDIDPRDFGLVKPTYSIREVIEGGPLKRTALYRAIKEKKIRIVKFGKKSIVLAPDYAAFLASLRPEG